MFLSDGQLHQGDEICRYFELRPRYELLSEFLGELAEMFAVKTVFTRLAT